MYRMQQQHQQQTMLYASANNTTLTSATVAHTHQWHATAAGSSAVTASNGGSGSGNHEETATSPSSSSSSSSSPSFSPAQAEADRRRGLEETYTTPIVTTSVKTLTAVTEFMSDFNKNQQTYEATFQRHLEEYRSDLAVLYGILVPHEVPHKTFLQRYFFRCCHSVEQIQDELDRMQQQQQAQQQQQLAQQKEAEEEVQRQMTIAASSEPPATDASSSVASAPTSGGGEQVGRRSSSSETAAAAAVFVPKASLAFHQEMSGATVAAATGAGGTGRIADTFTKIARSSWGGGAAATLTSDDPIITRSRAAASAWELPSEAGARAVGTHAAAAATPLPTPLQLLPTPPVQRPAAGLVSAGSSAPLTATTTVAAVSASHAAAAAQFGPPMFKNTSGYQDAIRSALRYTIPNNSNNNNNPDVPSSTMEDGRDSTPPSEAATNASKEEDISPTSSSSAAAMGTTRRTSARDLISKLEGGSSSHDRSNSVVPSGGVPLPSGRAARRHSFRASSSPDIITSSSSTPSSSLVGSTSACPPGSSSGGGGGSNGAAAAATARSSGPPITQPHLRRNLRNLRSSSFSNRGRGVSPACTEQHPPQDEQPQQLLHPGGQTQASRSLPQHHHQRNGAEEQEGQKKEESGNVEGGINGADDPSVSPPPEPSSGGGGGIVTTRLQSWRSRDAKNSTSIPRRSFSLDTRRAPRRSTSSEALASMMAAGAAAAAAAASVETTTAATGSSNVDGTTATTDEKTAADSLAVKSVVRANRRRNLRETYMDSLDSSQDEDPEIVGYVQTFDLEAWNDDILIALARYRDSVAIQHHELVVSTKRVGEHDFWCRYFYRCDEKRILKDLRRKDQMGILGHSTRNLFQSINVKAAMNKKPPVYKEFSRGPNVDRAVPASSRKYDHETSSSAATLDTVSTAATESTRAEQSTTGPEGGDETSTRPPVQRAKSDNQSRVGSIKEKLKNWSKVTSTSNGAHASQGTDRARRYRARRVGPIRSQSLPAGAEPPKMPPAARASGS